MFGSRSPDLTRVFVSAGEPSGDVYAAQVVAALRVHDPGMAFEGVGGAAMRAAGVSIVQDAGQLAVMGVAEALPSVPKHLRLLRLVERRFQTVRFDLVVVVDYPGFHLRVARIAARHGLPVLYYIAPQLWAWGAWRMRSLRNVVRSLAVVLPFEEQFFRAHDVPACFVGHPLMDARRAPDRAAARASLGVPDDAPVLALFPGSRVQERRRLWPVFRDTTRIVRGRMPALRPVVASVPGAGYDDGGDAILCEDSDTVLAAADAVLCKSGTATLQAALSDVPMVIAYKMHPMSFALARHAVRIRRVGLVNLVAGQDVAPEFLQSEATPGALAGAVEPLLDGASEAASRQRESFLGLRSQLGGPGVAQRVADLALDLVA